MASRLTMCLNEPVTFTPPGDYLIQDFEGYRLHTALQPIFSLAHKRVVGYEALLRVKDCLSQWISPIDFFAMSQSFCDATLLEGVCHHLHLHNFLTIDDPINWLFLNVSPRTILHGNSYGNAFRQFLNAVDMPPQRVVIEIVENPIEDNELLLDTVDYYREMGCLIAIDDFGAGHSNFDRIWALKPDIVKLDRSFLIKASLQKTIRNMLPGIISLLHQAGSLVLLEGVETRDQAMMAIESEADFVQGFFFGRPMIHLESFSENPPDFDSLFDAYKIAYSLEQKTIARTYEKYNAMFSQAIDRLRQGCTLTEASEVLCQDAMVVRCYQIGVNGLQIGRTIVSTCYRHPGDSRYRPLEDASSADWFRRHYLRRAIIHPDQLQITRPYLSITGAHMCVTLSMKFSGPDSDSVLCCDLTV